MSDQHLQRISCVAGCRGNMLSARRRSSQHWKEHPVKSASNNDDRYPVDHRISLCDRLPPRRTGAAGPLRPLG